MSEAAAQPYVHPADGIYDDRNRPEFWTAERVVADRTTRRDLWAVCDGCGLQRRVEPGRVIDSGRGALPIKEWRLKCEECGGSGHAKMTWVNPPRHRPDKPKWLGKDRPGSYDFSTATRTGSWD